MSSRWWTLYFDGCSKGNPGRAGAGAVLRDEAGLLWSRSRFVGARSTCNEAEYWGVRMGLQEVLRRVEEAGGQPPEKVVVRGDSMLVIRQLEGSWQVRSPALAPLYAEAYAIVEKLRLELGIDVLLEHIPRAENAEADAVCNAGVL